MTRADWLASARSALTVCGGLALALATAALIDLIAYLGALIAAAANGAH